MLVGGWLVAAAFVAAVGTGGLIRYLQRYRSKPGADWFLASLTCQALWNGTYGIALLVFEPPVRWALEVLSFGLLVGLSLSFVAFALEYTGRGRVRGRRALGVALAPVATVVVAATNPLHGLFYTGYSPASVAGLSTVEYAFEPLALAFGTVVAALPIAGSLLLFDTVFSYGPLYRREAVAVGVSTVPPMVPLVVWFYGLGPFPAVNLAPALFLPHVALDAYAFVGSDMFEFHPATRRAGERAAIDDLGNPVVIVDERGRIVTLNPAAESVLGVEKAAALATPLGECLDGSGVDPSRTDQRVTVRTTEQPRTFAVTSTPLSPDGRGDPVGYTLVWQDVTEQLRREQRLAVLNRVLRHNLRNDVTVIRGFASTAANTVDDEAVGEMLGTVVERADALAAHGQTARDIERVLAGEPRPESIDLRDLLGEIVADARERSPAATVALACPPVAVTADRETLRAVCVALLDNAVTHAGPEPSVTVDVEAGADTVAVSVVDDGPGLPEAELAVIEAGEETPLEHGSGLGLWLVRWGARRLGASVAFETGADGTTATLSLPAG